MGGRFFRAQTLKTSITNIISRWEKIPDGCVCGAFFYDPTQHKLSQAHTILQVLKDLKKEGVYLHCHPVITSSDIVANIWDKDEFILMTGKGSMKDDSPLASMLSQNLPVFAIVRGASASLYDLTTSLLVDDRLTTLIRNTNLLDLSLNNCVSDENTYRYHVRLINESEGIYENNSREKIINKEHLAKIFTGYSIATYPRLDSLVESQLHLNENRPIDISFVGSANYGIEAISRHRQLAAKTVSELSSSGFNVHVVCTRSRNNQTAVKYKLKEFYSILAKSKIALSPWGLGEVCIRDFETMLSGALMIKPDMSHLVTNPPFYRAGETYIPCRTDFSDLPDLVEKIIENWSQYDDIRQEAYNVVINSRKPENVAKQVAALVYDGLAIHHSQ